MPSFPRVGHRADCHTDAVCGRPPSGRSPLNPDRPGLADCGGTLSEYSRPVAASDDGPLSGTAHLEPIAARGRDAEAKKSCWQK